ncbi:MAG: hypothetical protein CVV41_21660 [Candidatus Riflebacteria bacterium HGW-Riflebacteria-1]|jgi:hypothetical protein|nr:MAG: hypothetical protein CVV41_21660 [Candidatus Riflebacteria bacterium HGW-Riflebacteria-1]
MGEIIFLTILSGIVICPLYFLYWTISRINQLQKESKEQIETLEGLQERLTRLQSSLWRIEKAVGSDHDKTPVAQAQPSHSVARVPEKTDKPDFAQISAPSANSPVSTEKPVAAMSGRVSPENVITGHDGAKVQHSKPSPDMLEADASPGAADDAQAVDSRQVNAFFENIERGAHDGTRQAGADSASRRSKYATSRPERPQASEQTDWSKIDLESLIGGNLMNKAGGFLLVIGLALFLNYSFASLGPWAKLAAGAAFSAILLAWGVFLEHNRGGNLMATGLIGSGWSCLYLTAFAAHGVAATKVVESPLLAVLLLIAVSLGMIIHSLRYRSEVATGLAFIFAFAGLFVAEVSLFSEVAAVIMAIGMLAVSWYFDWHQLATAGLLLTYGSMLARLHMNAPPPSLGPLQRVMFLQTLLFVLWSTYELTSMTFMRRNPKSEEPTRFLFPLNFVAYLGASLLTWPMVKETPLYYLAGLITLQYVATGLARGMWCSNPGEAAVEKARFFLGSCEDSLVIAAGALCYGLWYLLPSPVVVIGWAVVGLILVEVAYRLPWQLMRFFGHFIVTLSFFRVFIANLAIDGNAAGISHRLLTVVPVIFMMLHLYYRTDTELTWEASPTGGSRQFAPTYSYFSVVLAAVLIRFEFGPGLTPPIWAVAALAMTGLGQYLKNWHFKRQGLYLAVGALGYGLGNDWRCDSIYPILASPWTTGIVTVSCLYACHWLSAKDTVPLPDSIISGIDGLRPHILSLSGSIGLAFLLYVQISGGYLTLAWSLLGMGLLVVGFVAKDRLLRFSGLGLVVLCIVKVFLYDVRVLEAPLRILAFICLGATMMAISWAYTRYRARIEELLK